MKYDITYACGHEGTVSVFGKSRDRERKIEWLKKQICPECEKKERQKQYAAEAKEAKEEADELGLPELEGTEKQVEWALTIRSRIISDAMRVINIKRHPEKKEYKEKFINWLCNHDKARFWIDVRGGDILYLEYAFKDEETKKAREARKDEADELELVKPQQQETDVIAIVRADDGEIRINSDKDEAVIETAKKMGYKWSRGAWRMKITEKTGTIDDRVIEAGNRLLSAGVPVKIAKEFISKAVNGEYLPRSNKWIIGDGDYLYISWERDLDYYKEAKALPGARWESGSGMRVKNDYFNEIEEFANLYNFTITGTGKAALERAKEKINGAKTVQPIKKEEPEDKKPDLKDIMTSSRDILDDLRDD